MKTKSLVFMLAVFIVAFPIVATADDAAAVYKAKCAMCHGPDGSGQTPTGKAMKVHDLGSPEVQKMSNDQLEKVISDGKGKMPAYKSKVDAASIKSLVKYIRDLGIKK